VYTLVNIHFLWEKKHVEICCMIKVNIIVCKAARGGMRQNEREKRREK